jgi:hypothetical protein
VLLADVTARARRFNKQLFGEASEAVATGTSQRRLAAVPALSRMAAAWPLQPIAQRLSQVVVVIDESVLLLASASNDMSPEVRSWAP